MTEKLIELSTFKEKLAWLLDNHPHPEGRRYSDREIAEAIGKTPNYVWRLRNDPNVNNPTLEVAEAIANFFGHELGVFATKFEPVEHLQQLSGAFISQIAMRAPALEQLSPEDKLALLRVIDHMLKNQPAKEQAGSHS